MLGRLHNTTTGDPRGGGGVSKCHSTVRSSEWSLSSAVTCTLIMACERLRGREVTCIGEGRGVGGGIFGSCLLFKTVIFADYYGIFWVTSECMLLDLPQRILDVSHVAFS